ncbi:MAG: hypothetical protein ABMA15_04360 [Vicinamibacterales bacterium]
MCGCAILPGTQIEWTKDGGARHLTPEECETAKLLPSPVEPPLRGPQPELPEERAQVEHLLLSHPWKAATSKAYAKLPHEYSLRRLWPHDQEFAWCVEYIRRVGYQERFIGRVWTYLDAGQHQYWTMGAPVPETTLINRAVKR